jgi:large subunit ribosomal protein L24
MITITKIKKGDTVRVMKGKNRGAEGKVVRIIPKLGKILVEGVNQKIRHVRPRRAGEKGQRLEVIHPIWAANAQVVCSSCGKVTRVGFEIMNGVKARICKKCKATIS